MKIITRMLSIILVVAIPIVSLSIGINVSSRLPDAYQYAFKSTDELEGMRLELTNDEMGEFLSDFMLGKLDTLQIWTGEKERPQPVFNEEELAAATQIRHYINIVAIMGAVLFALMIFCFIMLKRKELNKSLRRSYCRGLIIYVILLLMFLVYKILETSDNFTIWSLTDYVVEENTRDILPQLISANVVKCIRNLGFIISSLLMTVIGYTTYKITEPKKIFSRK